MAIALNVLYAKKEKIHPVYVSKQNSNRQKQVIFSMIPKGIILQSKNYQHY